MIKHFCIVLLVAFVAANESFFKDCGHHEFIKFDVDQCPGEVCTLHKGKALNLNAEFVANQNTTHLHVHLTAKMDGLELPIPGVDKDGCKYIQCPLVKGEHYKLAYHVKIPKILPDINAELGATITGDQGVVACLSLKASLKN